MHGLGTISLVTLGLLALLRLVTILPICLCLPRVRSRGRALLGAFRLRDYDAISKSSIRNERGKTTILLATTDAFRAVGELDGQLLRT